MGKRSDFERIEKDFYPTIDLRAGEALNKFFEKNQFNTITYAEPCVGGGHLISNLEATCPKLQCVYKSDISDGVDALSLEKDDLNKASHIITNPPWDRKILHPMIEHFVTLSPTWLLFDASWAHTRQSSEYVKKYCTHIISIGRLKWIEGTTMSGKDDCAWYRFDYFGDKPTIFIGR